MGVGNVCKQVWRDPGLAEDLRADFALEFCNAENPGTGTTTTLSSITILQPKIHG